MAQRDTFCVKCHSQKHVKDDHCPMCWVAIANYNTDKAHGMQAPYWKVEHVNGHHLAPTEYFPGGDAWDATQRKQELDADPTVTSLQLWFVTDTAPHLAYAR